MTRDEFRAMAASRLIRLDGATGTELAKRGMPGGVGYSGKFPGFYRDS